MERPRGETLRFNLLGPFEAYREEAPIPDATWKRKKTRSLLELLLAERGQILTNDQLIDQLFGDLEPDKAARNLRARISELRRALEPDLEKGTLSRWVIKKGEGYYFPRDSAAVVDIESFHSLIATARDLQKTERWSQALENYAEALELWRGEFLLDALYNDWTQPYRAEGNGRKVEALSGLAECHARLGDYHSAIGHLAEALEIDPFAEHLVRDQMLYYQYADEPERALEIYEKFVNKLRDELDSEPTSDTSELRDLIYRGKVPPLSRVIPSNLPHPPTQFVGRHEELKKIYGWLLDQTAHHRLLTLIGPGGIGKTRLAIEASARALKGELCEDGVFFVSLAAVETPDQVVPAIAQALQFSFYGNELPKRQLLKYLKQKSLLLILDNFEQILDAVDLVSDLQSECKNVVLIATSRERLRLQGEHAFDLTGLSYPAELSESVSMRELDGYSAIDLFNSRATQLRADFATDEKELRSIIEICQLLEGSPLGIELAASWVRVLSPQEILTEIRKSIDFLKSAEPDVPERHQSLRAVFEQSWRFLSDEEQRIFLGLTTFRGGFDRAAAESVTNSNISTTLALIDKSFVKPTAEGRYFVHELMRQMGAEKLAEDAALEAQLRAKHGEYFAQFLGNLEGSLNSSDQLESYKAIGLDINNLRAAWNWALEVGSFDTFAQYIICIFEYYDMQGWLHEGRALFSSAYDQISQHDGNLQIRSQLKSRLGWFYFRLGNYDEAEASLNQAVEIAQKVNFESEIALVSNYLGILARVKGEIEVARDHHERTIEISQRLGNQVRIARAKSNLGVVCQLMGQMSAAEKLYNESYQLGQELGDDLWCDKVLSNLGHLAHAQGRNDDAKRMYQSSLDFCRKIGDRLGVGKLLNNLGNLAVDDEDWTLAMDRYTESLQISEQLGERYLSAILHSSMGGVAINQGNLEEAKVHIDSAIRTAQEVNAVPIVIAGLIEAEKLLSRGGERDFAVRLLSVVVEHPATIPKSREIASERLEELKAELPAKKFSSAQKAAHSQSLDEITESVIDALQQSAPTQD